MLMQDFLLARKSNRNFKAKSLSKDLVGKVEVLLQDINSKEEGISFKLLTDGKKVCKDLDGKAGYSGVMIEAPAYISLHVEHKTPEEYIRGAYGFESLVTELKKIGLGSCWITMAAHEEEEINRILGVTVGTVKYLLAIGEPRREFNFGQAASSDRLAIEDFVFIGSFNRPATMEELDNMRLGDLFFYVRMAPSSYNEQPWRFLIENGGVTLYAAANAEGKVNYDTYVDCGIIMYYFDALAESLSLDSGWDIEVEKNGEYVKIGRRSL